MPPFFPHKSRTRETLSQRTTPEDLLPFRVGERSEVFQATSKQQPQLPPDNLQNVPIYYVRYVETPRPKHLHATTGRVGSFVAWKLMRSQQPTPPQSTQRYSNPKNPNFETIRCSMSSPRPNIHKHNSLFIGYTAQRCFFSKGEGDLMVSNT